MAHKVALINMKGGVGKSTLAANLAWAMATRPWNKRVLVVDLDPQFNCSQYLAGAQKMESIISQGCPTVWDIYEQHTTVPGRPSVPLDPADTIVSVYPPSAQHGTIDLIPSRLELAQTLRNPAGKEGLLNQAVEQLEDEYDLVIIDCAPTESMLTMSAYLVADHILIPVRPEYLSAIGLPLLEESLNEFASRHQGKAPKVLGIVFTATSDYAPEEIKTVAEVWRIATLNGWRIFDARMRYSKSFPKGAREGRPIFQTSYVRTTVKQSFEKLASEFANEIGL